MSVLCPSYQHARFIRDALDGFLAQETWFPFEVIIRDDASTDGTAQIVRDYADRYPKVIRPMLLEHNSFGRAHRLAEFMSEAGGRFIAPCDGDDYWFRSDHLSSRLERLLADPGASAVLGGGVTVRDGRVVDVQTRVPARGWHWAVPTRTLVYRASAVRPTIRGVNGDMEIALGVQRAGRVVTIDSCSTAYRLHDGGISSPLTTERRKIELVKDLLIIAESLARDGELDLARRYHDRALSKAGWSLAALGLRPRRVSTPSTARRLPSSIVARVRRMAADMTVARRRSEP